MPQKFQPTMFIFAGNNGSGKSTIRNLIAEKIGIDINIDPDSLTRKHRSKDAINPEMLAAKEAISLINDCIKNRRSFSMETTLSGKLAIKQIREAKSNGFEIIMFFVGLEDIEFNIKRVASRVKSGGHHIPTEDILRRKERSVRNLINNISIIDYIQVIDNTEVNAEIVLEVDINQLLYQSEHLPTWVIPIKEALNKRLYKI